MNGGGSVDQQPEEPDDAALPATDDISRRQSMKVGAGIIALAQCLGLPAALLAQSSAAAVELRYYRTVEGATRLVYAEPLASPVMEMLMGGEVAELELKWYHGNALLGSARVPPEVQLKLARELQVKPERS
jgi:hypothetical protein